MLKNVLIFGGGAVVGVLVLYGVYRYYKSNKDKETDKNENEDVFAQQLKEKEEANARFSKLIENQSTVDMLTARDLSVWFRANRNRYSGNIKQMILTPTMKHMRGLGFSAEDILDESTNIIQLFYDADLNAPLEMHLISYADIDSNLQAQLIERDGMIIITD